jgi:hypothetical protein
MRSGADSLAPWHPGTLSLSTLLADNPGKVFYFFQRGEEFLQCEIRGDDATGYEIVITEPKRPERRESFPTSHEAYARWVQLQDSLVSAGWWGPHGRD